MTKNYAETLAKCAEIANARQEEYGQAQESIRDSVDILAHSFGIILTPREFCFVMVAGKLSREKNMHKEDNLLDAINYLAIASTL